MEEKTRTRETIRTELILVLDQGLLAETQNEAWRLINELVDMEIEDAPNCDECDVHAKAAERGPPESHYSQQDR